MDLQRTFEIFNDYGRPKVIKKDILQSVRKSCTLMNDIKIFIDITPPKGYYPPRRDDECQTIINTVNKLRTGWLV